MPADIVSRGIAAAHAQGLVRRTVIRLAACIALLTPCVLSLLADDAAATIVQRITTTNITLPQALEGATNNFCTWGFCSGFGPRLYQAPLADGRTLIGWTDANGNGHVSRVSGATVEATFDFVGTPVRGLVAHADDSFAVLLLDFATPGTKWDNNMKLSKRTAGGAEVWTTQLLNSASAVPNPTLFGDTGIGDSRLAYGGGKYGAYFSAHSVPDGGGVEHEGDQLTFVNDAGVIQAGGWAWGLSHSMAVLIDYHPDLARLTAFGGSDCFPGKGLFADHTRGIL